MRVNGPLQYRIVITPKFRTTSVTIIDLPEKTLEQAAERLAQELDRYRGEAGGRIEESLGDGSWHYAGGVKHRLISAFKSGKGFRG